MIKDVIHDLIVSPGMPICTCRRTCVCKRTKCDYSTNLNSIFVICVNFFNGIKHLIKHSYIGIRLFCANFNHLQNSTSQFQLTNCISNEVIYENLKLFLCKSSKLYFRLIFTTGFDIFYRRR